MGVSRLGDQRAPQRRKGEEDEGEEGEEGEGEVGEEGEEGEEKALPARCSAGLPNAPTTPGLAIGDAAPQQEAEEDWNRLPSKGEVGDAGTRDGMGEPARQLPAGQGMPLFLRVPLLS